MLRLFLLTAILMANMMTMSAAKKSSTVIDRIEPTDWFVGMKNPSVQLMAYGKGIRNTEAVTTDYPGVTIDSLVRLDSPNYLLVYLFYKSKLFSHLPNLYRILPCLQTASFCKCNIPASSHISGFFLCHLWKTLFFLHFLV